MALDGSLPIQGAADSLPLKICSHGIFLRQRSVGGIFRALSFHRRNARRRSRLRRRKHFSPPADSIGAFALAGMGRFLLGSSALPWTSVLIIFEMTGSYGLVLPLMIANMSALRPSPPLASHVRSTRRYWKQDGVHLPMAKARQPKRTPPNTLAKSRRSRTARAAPRATLRPQYSR